MISDKNILRFLYFLFFIFLSVHLKKKICFWKELFLEGLAFSEIRIALNQLRRPCFLFCNFFLGGREGGRAMVSPPFTVGRGNVFQAPISNIKRFPLQFFLFNFLSFLASCFLLLHFEASPNSSFDIELWSRQERDRWACRRKAIRNCPLFST